MKKSLLYFVLVLSIPPAVLADDTLTDVQGDKIITRSYTATGEPEAAFSSTSTDSSTEE